MAGKMGFIDARISSKKANVANLLQILQISGWFILLDLSLLVTALLLIFSDAVVLLFHIIFILLTVGAFFWKFPAFAVRAIFWVTVTTVEVLITILAGQTQVEEIIEIPLLTAILILVFVIAEQRSRAETALRQGEEKYSTLYENLFKESIDAIFVTNQQGKIIDINQAMLELFGVTRDEIIGLDYQELYVRPDAQSTFQQQMEQNGFVRNYEVQLRRKDNKEMYCLLTTSVWRANDGSSLGYQGIIHDITKRKRAQQSLRESEERYRRLVELSFEGITVHAEGRFLHVNFPAAKILGATGPHEILGKPVLDFVHPDYLEIVKDRIQQAKEQGAGAPLVEEKLLWLDGISVDVEVAAVPIVYQGLLAVQTVIRDITPRKKAEAERERLLATEHEQRLLAETLGEVFLALTAQTNYETVLDEILSQVQRIISPSAANIVLLKDDSLQVARYKGYRAFESKGLALNLEQSLQDFPLDAEVVRSGQPLVISDTRKNTQWVSAQETDWIRSFIAVPICHRDVVLGLLRLDSDTANKFSAETVERLQPLANAAAIALENARLYDKARQEIAERIEVEKELRLISARNQAILDAIPDSIFHLNRKGQILDYKVHDDNLMSELIGEISLGKTLDHTQGLSPDVADLFLYYIGKALDTGLMQIFEYQLHLPQQETRYFETWLVISGSDEVLAVVRDVTERKVREAAVEKERSRIARDLHDSLGQNLGYLRLKLDE